MKIDLYERIWLWIATVMIGSFLAAIVLGATMNAVHPPSHVETIDPTTVRTSSEFSRPRVEINDDGSALVVGVAEMFDFEPFLIRVPSLGPITFRLTSPDVIHGFQIVGTNVNLTVTPGYVIETTVTLPKAGEYLIVCNEYCGLSHHQMTARLIVGEGDGP